MPQKRIIQLPCVLDSANRKKDGSVTLKFVTVKELTTDEYMVVDTYRLANGWLLFSEQEFNEEDIPEEDFEPDISKSQSIQVRDVLWVMYKAKGNNTGDKEAWNRYYKTQMQAFKARILGEVHLIEGK